MSDSYRYNKEEKQEDPKIQNKGFRYECKCKREIKCSECICEKPVIK